MADTQEKVIDLNYLRQNLEYFTKKLGPKNWLTQHAQKALDDYLAGNTNAVFSADPRITFEELDDLVNEATGVTGWIGVFAPTSGPRLADSQRALAEANQFVDRLKKLRDRVRAGG